MIAKEYLSEYKRIDDRVRMLQGEVEKLRTDAESISINLDAMPKGSAVNDKTARIAILLAECESELTEELSRMWRKRVEIVGMLGHLKESKYQRLLYSRYIEGKTWETIAYEMGISWRYCYMLHGHALNEFDRILKKYK